MKIPETDIMKYELAHIGFNWSYIKDKQIDIEGDQMSGLIIITDKNDNIIEMYGYEMVEKDSKGE